MLHRKVAFIAMTLENCSRCFDKEVTESNLKKLMFVECDQNNCFLLNYSASRLAISQIFTEAYVKCRKIIVY